MVEVHRQHLFIWEHGEGSLEKFINKLKYVLSNIKIYC